MSQLEIKQQRERQRQEQQRERAKKILDETNARLDLKEKNAAAVAAAIARRQAYEQTHEDALAQRRQKLVDERRARFAQVYVRGGGKVENIDSAFEKFCLDEAAAAIKSNKPTGRRVTL